MALFAAMLFALGNAPPEPDRSALPLAAKPRPAVTAQGVGNLPHAPGRTFRTLDDYLAFLRKQGAMDKPWYREIEPGLYRLETPRLTGRAPQTFTREELERKFGFAK